MLLIEVFNGSPYFVPFKVMEFFMHSINLIGILKSIFNPKGFNTRYKGVMLTKIS